jgi:16S rRNA G966 N2-methylase RsmD
MLINNLDKIYAGKYGEISVLDLGSGEGAMSLALWNKGVRDITCVEVRDDNIEKAKFVFKYFGVKADIIQNSIEDFLNKNTKQYDVVIFMGILYHLLNPFEVMKKISEIVKNHIVIETVVAKVTNLEFGNRNNYSPTKEGFFIRVDTTDSSTAGLSNLELWPTMGALNMLMNENNFEDVELFEFDLNAPFDYLDKERIIGICKIKNN